MLKTVSETVGKTRRLKPATLQDVALGAGVHSRTVNDALRGTGRVAPATRERVQRVARELNYVPNAMARALATGRTGTIAVLSGPLNETFYASMVHELEAHLTKSGFEMLLLQTRREAKDLVQATQASLVDGVIVIGVNHFIEEFLCLSQRPLQSCVFIDTSSFDFVDHITLDLRPALEEALQLMLAAGRHRIAYVANNRDEAAHSEVRMAIYLQMMKEAGRIAEVIDVSTQMPPEARIQAVKSYIETHGCPDALLCQNDETAIYTFRAVTGAEYRLPEDVLLVGCDGLPYMEFFDPPLSTIQLPMPDICGRAVQFLQNRLANPDLPLQEATLAGRLVVRESLLWNS